MYKEDVEFFNALHAIKKIEPQYLLEYRNSYWLFPYKYNSKWFLSIVSIPSITTMIDDICEFYGMNESLVISNFRWPCIY